MPLGDWAQAGVRSVDGLALPARPLQARLIMPAGNNGPAYLVYSNLINSCLEPFEFLRFGHWHSF